jgi:hypothetical protein
MMANQAELPVRTMCRVLDVRAEPNMAHRTADTSFLEERQMEWVMGAVHEDGQQKFLALSRQCSVDSVDVNSLATVGVPRTGPPTTLKQVSFDRQTQAGPQKSWRGQVPRGDFSRIASHLGGAKGPCTGCRQVHPTTHRRG